MFRNVFSFVIEAEKRFYSKNRIKGFISFVCWQLTDKLVAFKDRDCKMFVLKWYNEIKIIDRYLNYISIKSTKFGAFQPQVFFNEKLTCHFICVNLNYI